MGAKEIYGRACGFSNVERFIQR